MRTELVTASWLSREIRAVDLVVQVWLVERRGAVTPLPSRSRKRGVGSTRSDQVYEIQVADADPEWLEAAISSIFSPVLPVIAAVIAAIVSSVDPVGDNDGATNRRYGAAPASGCEWHG